MIDKNKQGTESTLSIHHTISCFSRLFTQPCTFGLGSKDIMSPLSMSSASSNRERERERAFSSQSQSQQPPTPSAKSHRTYPSEQYGSEYDLQPSVYTDMDIEMEELEGEAVHFCLLAEFDIDAGATLTDQYPHPTGTDEQ